MSGSFWRIARGYSSSTLVVNCVTNGFYLALDICFRFPDVKKGFSVWAMKLFLLLNDCFELNYLCSVMVTI